MQELLPPEKIVAFIRRHHVLTLATIAGNQPWCSSIFYAYIPSLNLFVFASEPHTRHACEALANPRVAGSIVLETKIVGRVQGLQLTGVMKPVRMASHSGDNRCECNASNGSECGTGNNNPYDAGTLRKAYLRRFPYAAAMPSLELWVLAPDHMKLTDNTLGFGKKLVWNRD